MAADKVALIVGGSECADEAIAQELIRREWKIVLQGPDAEELNAAAVRASEFSSAPDQVATFLADRTDPAQREQLVEFMLEEFGRIDLLVSAPLGPTVNESLLEMNEQAYAQVMDAYVTSTVFLTQLAANEMVRMTEAETIESGKIILVNSICAYTVAAERAARCLAAAATAMVAALFADALAAHGINVYEIRAGLIDTGGEDDVHARYGQLIEEGLTPIRRWGRPQDIALAVAAVAEDLLPFSTGEVINVDGGFHLRRL